MQLFSDKSYYWPWVYKIQMYIFSHSYKGPLWPIAATAIIDHLKVHESYKIYRYTNCIHCILNPQNIAYKMLCNENVILKYCDMDCIFVW